MNLDPGLLLAGQVVYPDGTNPAKHVAHVNVGTLCPTTTRVPCSSAFRSGSLSIFLGMPSLTAEVAVSAALSRSRSFKCLLSNHYVKMSIVE